MDYETDADWMRGECERAGLPVIPQIIQGVQADTKAETQENIKAMAAAIAGHAEAKKQARQAEARKAYDELMRQGRRYEACRAWLEASGLGKG